METWIAQQRDQLDLTDEQITRLHNAGYKKQTDFRRITVDNLMLDTGLTRPAATRVLEAAGALDQPAPSAGHLHELGTLLDALRRDPACQPTRVKLRRMGVERACRSTTASGSSWPGSSRRTIC